MGRVPPDIFKFIMFILQRLSDKKYWKNGTQDKHWDKVWRESQWTDDISQCRPFKTEAAAMHSRGTSFFWKVGDKYPEWRKRLLSLVRVVGVRVSIEVKE